MSIQSFRASFAESVFGKAYGDLTKEQLAVASTATPNKNEYRRCQCHVTVGDIELQYREPVRDLSGSNFSDTEFRSGWQKDFLFVNTLFKHTFFKGAVFCEARYGVAFYKCDFSHADFSGARFHPGKSTHYMFRDCVLVGANFQGAQTHSVYDLQTIISSGESVKGMIYVDAYGVGHTLTGVHHYHKARFSGDSRFGDEDYTRFCELFETTGGWLVAHDDNFSYDPTVTTLEVFQKSQEISLKRRQEEGYNSHSRVGKFLSAVVSRYTR